MLIMRTLNINLEEYPERLAGVMYALSFFGMGQIIKGLVQYLLYIKTILVYKNNDYHE